MSIYNNIAKHYWGLLIVATVLGVLVSWLITAFVIVPTYTSRAQIFVGTTSDSRDSAGLNQSGQFAQQRVKTYAELITSPRVLDPVIANLGLGVSASELASQVTATAPLNTVLINVEVTDQNPRIAQAATNMIVEQFALLAPELETPDSEQRAPVRVTVATPAALPIRADGQRKSTYFALGALGGLALGTALALLRETLHPRYRRGDHLSSVADMPLLASLLPADLAASPAKDRKGADPFQLVRNKINSMGEHHELRSVLAVPACAADQTSTFALHLANSYAAAGMNVILMDGDLAQRHLSALLHAESTPGLTDILFGELTAKNGLVGTGLERVSILGGGIGDSASFDLSVTDTLKELVAEMEQMADIVIIDGPSPIENADALVWGQIASATVVLVGGGSLRSAVDGSISLLRASHARFLGAVVLPQRKTGEGNR